MWKRGETNTLLDILFSYIDSTISDHGIFRYSWSSWGKISPEMYRSNQPFPFQIRRNIKKYKIKTIINLRGERHCSSYYLEKKQCMKSDIKLINFPLSSRDLPTYEKTLNLKKLYNNIEYPALIHCKSGADRVGMAAALYLISRRRKNLLIAKKQLSLKHLHLKYAKTGILDFFFDSAIKQGVIESNDFFNWMKIKYKKEALKKEFKYNKLSDLISDFILKRE